MINQLSKCYPRTSETKIWYYDALLQGVIILEKTRFDKVIDKVEFVNNLFGQSWTLSPCVFHQDLTSWVYCNFLSSLTYRDDANQLGWKLTKNDGSSSGTHFFGLKYFRELSEFIKAIQSGFLAERQYCGYNLVSFIPTRMSKHFQPLSCFRAIQSISGSTLLASFYRCVQKYSSKLCFTSYYFCRVRVIERIIKTDQHTGMKHRSRLLVQLKKSCI